MLKIPNGDKTIFESEYRIMDIIKEYQTTGKIDIHLNFEGPSCEELSLYYYLDQICKLFDIDKSLITIRTCNELEQHSDYNIVQAKNPYYDMKYVPDDTQVGLNQDARYIGLFVGRSSWVRLWFLGWLDPARSLITSHLDRTNEFQISFIGSSLDNMIQHQASTQDITNSLKFLDHGPIVLDSIDSYPILSPAHLNLLKIYNQFFVELVCETFFSGKTFYPTEKTFRPIIGLKPFITHASPGYLTELKKRDYQTFNKWWSEEYDLYGDEARLHKMQDVLREILSWSPEKLHQVYSEMMPVLEHNRKNYFAKNRSRN
jgi:hypothetical protein